MDSRHLFTNKTARPTNLAKQRLAAVQNSEVQKAQQKRAFDKHAKIHNFLLHQQVLVRVHDFLNKNRRLATKFEGPYEIVKLFDNYAILPGKTANESKETFCISSHFLPRRRHTLPSLGQRSRKKGRGMVLCKHLTMRKSQTRRWQR